MKEKRKKEREKNERGHQRRNQKKKEKNSNLRHGTAPKHVFICWKLLKVKNNMKERIQGR